MPTRLLTILLIAVLISSNFSRFFICAGFEANQSYIAKVLCENKARPWLHCNGHCYLMKKLKQASEKEKKQEREDQKNRYQEALPQAPLTLAFHPTTLKNSYPPVVTPGILTTTSAIFQPPRAGAQQV